LVDKIITAQPEIVYTNDENKTRMRYFSRDFFLNSFADFNYLPTVKTLFFKSETAKLIVQNKNISIPKPSWPVKSFFILKAKED
jgi:hypothetical protein